MENTYAECTVLQHNWTDCAFYLLVFTVGLSKHNSIISQNICVRGLLYFITTFIKGDNQWSTQKYQWRRDEVEMITTQNKQTKGAETPFWSTVLLKSSVNKNYKKIFEQNQIKGLVGKMENRCSLGPRNKWAVSSRSHNHKQWQLEPKICPKKHSGDSSTDPSQRCWGHTSSYPNTSFKERKAGEMQPRAELGTKKK